MSGTRTDVVVIGAGMVGVSTALHCLDRGLSVVLVDGGDARRRASFGNAGAISRGSIFPVASPSVMKRILRYVANADPGLRIEYGQILRIWPWMIRFLLSANERSWREAARWLDPFVAGAFAEHARLAAEAGASHLLEKNGWIKLFRTPEAFEGSAIERRILGDFSVAVDILDGNDLRRLEPALKREFWAGMLFPETGHARDPGGLLAAYEALVMAKGGVFVRSDALDMASSGDGWRVQADRAISARSVVLAAGAWSDGLARRLGFAFPMAAERGYHAHFASPQEASLIRTIYDVAGGYVAAPMNKGIRILSGIELAPRDAPPDLRQLNDGIAEASATLSLGPAIDSEPWVGSRPSTPDGLPVIGPAPGRPGLFFAFGHGHIGFSTGPVTGRIVADLITGREPHIEVRGFSPERLLSWSDRELRRRLPWNWGERA